MGIAGGIHWEEHGQPDGPAILLSSGLGGSGSYWQPNLAALSAGTASSPTTTAAPAVPTPTSPAS